MRKAEDESFDDDTVSAAAPVIDYEEEEEDENDERYLGKSTLAKLRDAKLFDEDSEDSADDE
ncbi:MAG: hypothetical protein UZ13_00637 [Chloroflexi bacterium OLB13]|nr:MAG: hypothetical protein UZ13_00637 [Chloroflexi bacterium OLB13]